LPGKIITFYSYKGGTGRSMLLANVAWILASKGKRVLAIDWDLEAPGLHYYLRPFLKDKVLAASPGVIDFVIDFGVEAMTPDRRDVSADWYVPYANVPRYASAVAWNFPHGGALHFVPAGKQGPQYASRVNLFNWQNFYHRLGGGALLEAARTRMAAEYDFVLIDSRTGISDTSGICTLQMPDTLVVCFSMNNQSIDGAAAVAASIHEQRRKEGDLLLPHIFPIPTRLDFAGREKLDLARKYAQSKFGALLGHLPEQARYWTDVEIPYFPSYSYEEVLGTFADKPGLTNSLLGTAERITGYLAPGESGRWEAPSDHDRERILSQFAW
jgi:cellulose biosynthesis protein BcsQ